MSNLSDRCERCCCDRCNGSVAEHVGGACTCENCKDSPEYACKDFAPPGRIMIIAEQLGYLMSAHLHERARLRCLSVAHSAHHAIHDYDYPEAPS